METKEEDILPLVMATMEDLYVGAWVRVYSPITRRYTPPAKVTALFDGGQVQYMFDPEQGDPYEDKIENILPLPIVPDTLRGFGFGLSEHCRNLYNANVATVYYDGKFIGTFHDEPIFPGVYVERMAGSLRKCMNIHDLIRTIKISHIDTSKIKWKGIE